VVADCDNASRNPCLARLAVVVGLGDELKSACLSQARPGTNTASCEPHVVIYPLPLSTSSPKMSAYCDVGGNIPYQLMYDQFAAAYAADNESNAFNALYERPAMLALLGDLRGKRVLDVGCGSGALAEAMLERGATS
jgi:hypothetical protein